MKYLIILLLFLQGCSVLASREAAVGCQVADVATTGYAWHIGASEANPIIGKSWWRLIGIKGAIIYFIWTQWPKMEGQQGETAAKTIITTVSCLPVVNNIAVIRQQKAINAR